jgi:NAD(P)-dependent dehydrogenase (short-subunit alcohol dehydrogenase family)
MRLAVVTGASGGIGRAVADRLAADGHDLVFAGLDARPFDVTDEKQVEAALGSLPVDVLVCSAGAAVSAPFVRTRREDLDQLLAVNTTGTFLCMRAVLPGMRSRGWGRVVVVASTASLIGGRYIAAYAASKHAVLGLVRAAAAEVAGSEVTVNAVCPTFVDTPMTDENVARIVAASGRSGDEVRANVERASPLGRLVRPEEVAAAVAYLVSDLAAPVNGQALVLDGGAVTTR